MNNIEEINNSIRKSINNNDSEFLYKLVSSSAYPFLKINFDNNYFLIEIDNKYYFISKNKIERVHNIEINNKIYVNEHLLDNTYKKMIVSDNEWKEFFLKNSKNGIN